MTWEIHAAIQREIDSGRIDGALALIERHRSDTLAIRSFVACLEADCLYRKGALTRAIEVLEAHRGDNNFWVFYSLARLYREQGQQEKVFAAYREAHAAVGWTESMLNGYTFTHDYFSPNVPIWTDWFNTRILARPIRCLEIGSWQGGSATWLLDRVVKPRGGTLTCIDTFEGSSEHAAWVGHLHGTLEELFDSNIARTGSARLCRKLVGTSQRALRTLVAEQFDFIYVDGAHEAKYVIQDAVLSWGLLPVGGYLLFDDADFQFPDRPEQNTGPAIEQFTTWFADEVEIVSAKRQVLLQKVSE